MSRSFVWRPLVPPPPVEGSVELGMWKLLCQYFNTEDGSTDVLELDAQAEPWLRGVSDALGIDDERGREANELITALRKHGAILISVDH